MPPRMISYGFPGSWSKWAVRTPNWASRWRATSPTQTTLWRSASSSSSSTVRLHPRGKQEWQRLTAVRTECFCRGTTVINSLFWLFFYHLLHRSSGGVERAEEGHRGRLCRLPPQEHAPLPLPQVRRLRGLLPACLPTYHLPLHTVQWRESLQGVVVNSRPTSGYFLL